jgi:hypothetical protein
MSDATTSKTAPVLAWIAGTLLVLLSLWGLIAHGFSLDVHSRMWRDIAERPGGPMTFRFILQPTMAFIAALADGLKDARTGRSPYLWTLLTSAQERGGRLHEGLLATARIILLGLGMDAVYQATVLKTFYAGEMVLIALLLAFLPYVLMRGPIARIARWWLARHDTSKMQGG